MRIAVVGGGLFGVTSAIKIARTLPSASVRLFEKSDDILTGASEINQCRLHRGYHYPRSEDTAVTCKESESKFRREYPEAVIEKYQHYYCIANEQTKTSPAEFLEHCENLDLAYEVTDLDFVRDDRIDLCVQVDEDQVDPLILREICWNRLRDEDVSVELNREIRSIEELDDYDYTVVATYSNNNNLLQSHPSLLRDYKFQLIEKPVAAMPDEFHEISIIILDGPFMGVDPFGTTGSFHLDHVVHGVTAEMVGQVPRFEGIDPSWLNSGTIEDIPESNFSKFVEHGGYFFRGMENAEHLGSKFTVRTVLPDVEATDARPTIVDRSENVFAIFSGKLATCVTAAERVADAIGSEAS